MCRANAAHLNRKWHKLVTVVSNSTASTAARMLPAAAVDQ